MIASSVVLNDGSNSRETLSKVTPGTDEDLIESERCVAIAADPSCNPFNRLRGVNRHASSLPCGTKIFEVRTLINQLRLPFEVQSNGLVRGHTP
jgi:hypothetical protein